QHPFPAGGDVRTRRAAGDRARRGGSASHSCAHPDGRCAHHTPRPRTRAPRLAVGRWADGPSDDGGVGPPRRGRRGKRRTSRTAGTSPFVLTRPLPGCLIRHIVNNAIVTRGLRVRRGRATVIDGLDLEVPQGAIVGLLGPSGSGKTTL